MSRASFLLALALASIACTGDAPDPMPVRLAVPDGQACSQPLRLPEQSRDHIALGTTATYATDPPGSGEHWSAPAAPVPTGAYDEALPDEATLHNLEHGHVVAHHGDLPRLARDAIEAEVRAQPQWALAVPRPEMRWALALSAWNVVQVCDALPPDVGGFVRAFLASNRDRAPESIPGSPQA